MPKSLLLTLVLLVLSLPVSAAAPGLYAEHSTSVDGVTVRRVRDTTEGIVCYVAVGHSWVGGYNTSPGVGISCLR